MTDQNNRTITTTDAQFIFINGCRKNIHFMPCDERDLLSIKDTCACYNCFARNKDEWAKEQNLIIES